jgi:hypothetical protein
MYFIELTLHYIINIDTLKLSKIVIITTVL